MLDEEDNFFIEYIDDVYMIVRPNGSGLLTLINIETNEKVLLYKNLLNEDEQEFAEMNDVPFKGDMLKFNQRKGKYLYFENESRLTNQTKKHTFELN